MKKILLAMASIAVIVCGVSIYLCRQDIFLKDWGTNEDSSFFFPNKGTWEYYARFTEVSEASDEKIELHVMTVCNIKNDVVYELLIETNQEIQDRYGERLNLGYFFVTEDKIYLIREEILQWESLTKETLINIGTLVCQDEEKKDALASGESGWHEYIEADGNIRKYCGYNSLTETGYYEQFVWEKGTGLVKYKSGYGAEADGIELSLAGRLTP